MSSVIEASYQRVTMTRFAVI